MNLSDRTLQDAFILAKQKASKCKYHESWLIQQGNSTLIFTHLKPHGKVLFTFKWNKNKLDVYDEKGNKLAEQPKEAKVSQDVSNAPIKETGKSSKQSK